MLVIRVISAVYVVARSPKTVDLRKDKRIFRNSRYINPETVFFSSSPYDIFPFTTIYSMCLLNKRKNDNHRNTLLYKMFSLGNIDFRKANVRV